MRATTTCPARADASTRASATRRTPVAVAVVACLALGLTPSGALAGTAYGAPQDLPPGTPSRSDVEVAEQQAGQAAGAVAATKAQLDAANAELEAAAVLAEQASEAANGARWQLEQATDAWQAARGDARRAETEVADQRDEIAGLAVAGYQSAGDISSLDAAFGGEGPEGVMGRLLSYEGASTSMDADYQQFAATSALAQTFRDRATREKQRSEDLAEQAEAAQLQAAAAAESAQETAVAIAEHKSALIAELARLQGVSVELMEARQSGIEEARRQAAAEAAAREARQQQRAAARAAPEQADQAGQRAGQETGSAAAEQQPPASPWRSAPRPAPAAAPAPAPAPAPALAPAPAPPRPTAVTPPPTASGAQRAISFALAQVGEPYLWAAAGPGAWDCSGLTMAAWAAGGRSLPHYSVAQYTGSTPISAGQLRPGDLVFWGSTSNPGSIHHVALYVGGGQIVHAPRTGRDVSVESMYYWVPPNFFARV